MDDFFCRYESSQEYSEDEAADLASQDLPVGSRFTDSESSSCDEERNDSWPPRDLDYSPEGTQPDREDDDVWRPVEFYQGNEKTPYFWRGKKEFQLEEVLDILKVNVDGNRICTERPLAVAEDAAFVIDTRELLARKDYLEDNIGNFRNLGHCGKIFKLKNDRIVRRMEHTVKERQPLGEDEVLVKAVY
ncbi:hypothetical protein ACROYT_G042184 [Oculina patagonica]